MGIGRLFGFSMVMTSVILGSVFIIDEMEHNASLRKDAIARCSPYQMEYFYMDGDKMNVICRTASNGLEVK